MESALDVVGHILEMRGLGRGVPDRELSPFAAAEGRRWGSTMQPTPLVHERVQKQGTRMMDSQALNLNKSATAEPEVPLPLLHIGDKLHPTPLPLLAL